MAESKFDCRLTDVKTLGEREFSGYGSVFGNADLGGDIVLPGAFAASLERHAREGSWPLMFWMHDPGRVPGKWLELREDSRGLFVRGLFAKTPLGDEARELVKMKALAGLSIGFRTVRHDFDRNGNRLLAELELAEVSIVSMPMNPRAQVASAKDALRSIRDWETRLRDMGFSSRAATRLASKTWAEMTKELGDAATLNNITADVDEQRAVAALLASANTIRSL